MKVWGKLKANTGHNGTASTAPTKKDNAPPPLTPLQKLLQDAGPLRPDGSDKFYGMENPQYANVCYCNSILQCLYYSVPFREAVINYPRRAPQESLEASLATNLRFPDPNAPIEDKPKMPPPASVRSPGLILSAPPKPEDKDSPEYKKKVATNTLPVLETKDNATAYGMKESLFTALKDIFEALAASPERMGILKVDHFLTVLRRKYDAFRTAQHQDAHEFLNILLNEVVSNVEAETKRSLADADAQSQTTESAASSSLTATNGLSGTKSPNTARWVHELFEGTLTSETQCLTCEKVSQRDEVFLDLSVDLEQHASVTACLRKFSEEEMLCEKNKFHCDNCGGLQEAEKRMKIKRLPRVLALHLKRFKYTEENQQQRLQKLFHRVVYPYYLRLFNTTDDTEDPDRLYELYAVVVHIGGGPYHGHYVAIIKTEDRGWLLFDDEMVEPVDKSYVRNFFGDRPGQACAYVLFYQETTFEAMQEEMMKEGVPPLQDISEVKDTVPPQKMNGGPVVPDGHPVPAGEDAPKAQAAHPAATTNPSALPPLPPTPKSPFTALTSKKSAAGLRRDKSKDVKAAREEKERKAAEKAAEKEREKAEKEMRKKRQQMIRDEQKRLDAEMKAVIQASKESKAEDDRRSSVPSASEKENGTADHHSGLGLGRFMSRTRSVSQNRAKKGNGSVGQVPEVPPVPEVAKADAKTNANNSTKPKPLMDKSNGHDETESERRDTIDEPGKPPTAVKHSRFRLSKRSFSFPTK